MSLEKTCDLCGKVLKHQGALNIHKYHCKMKQAQKEQPKQEEPKQEEICEHNFRLLNLRAPMEKRAYDAGYKEVCIKCQEVN